MFKAGLAWLGGFVLAVSLASSCAGTKRPPGGATGSGGAGGGGSGGNGGGSGGNGGVLPGSGGSGGNRPPEVIENPETCALAATYKSYVGCEFWPTVTYNPVYDVFDFAAVVANPGMAEAEVTVMRGAQMVATAKVAPHSLQKIILPWVRELKGMQFDLNTALARVTTSVRVDGGAYKLTSTVPVTAWQFNPLQYRKPAAVCPFPPTIRNSDGMNCESVAADAALLIPATAMTGNYRVIGMATATDGSTYADTPGGFTITGTQNATHVRVQLTGDLAAGTGVLAGLKGAIVEFDLNAGDVIQLLGKPGPFADQPHANLSGSVVNANKPVQVVSFVPITNVPSPPKSGECCADHLEELVLPAEALGAHYVVAPPSTNKGTNVGHFVTFYGNLTGTTLTYRGAMPPGAPTALAPGDIVTVDATAGFEVTGTQAFALSTIMKRSLVQNGCANGAVDPACYIGDPSLSIAVAVEQFRKEYVFLAPDDYAFNWADVLVPTGATVKLDGAALAGTMEQAGPDWSVVRVKLGPGNGGEHTLESDQPIGLQVMGYGHATSYYYPGGLNLKAIALPPIIVQ